MIDITTNPTNQVLAMNLTGDEANELVKVLRNYGTHAFTMGMGMNETRTRCLYRVESVGPTNDVACGIAAGFSAARYCAQ